LGLRTLFEVAEVIGRTQLEVVKDFKTIVDVSGLHREVACEIVKLSTVRLSEHRLEVGFVLHVIGCLKSEAGVYIRSKYFAVQRLKVHKQLVNGIRLIVDFLVRDGRHVLSFALCKEYSGSEQYGYRYKQVTIHTVQKNWVTFLLCGL